MNRDMRIVVVCGGVSSEREVSLRSGAAVYRGLVEYGYRNVEMFDLQKDNLPELLAKKPDVAYLALHGKGGEDGCIQGALELSGIAYTGPGVETSAVCMNKILTKRILVSAGLPTAKFEIANRRDSHNTDELIDHLIGEIGLPMVLKSPCQGSSIGVVIVNKREEMADAINEIYTYGDLLLAEAYVKGVEVTLPILGNEELTVLPEIEIVSENEFYDYHAKYTNGMCHHILPARISEEARRKVQETGKAAYRALGCTGLSRIDYIIDESGEPIIIEVNTLPGMTEMSLFPDSARYVGMSFAELVSVIVELGYAATNKK